MYKFLVDLVRPILPDLSLPVVILIIAGIIVVFLVFNRVMAGRK